MIVVAGKEFRTLDDEFFVNGQKCMEAYVNGELVYPESLHKEVPDDLKDYVYVAVLAGSADVQYETYLVRDWGFTVDHSQNGRIKGRLAGRFIQTIISKEPIAILEENVFLTTQQLVSDERRTSMFDVVEAPLYVQWNQTRTLTKVATTFAGVSTLPPYRKVHSSWFWAYTPQEPEASTFWTSVIGKQFSFGFDESRDRKAGNFGIRLYDNGYSRYIKAAYAVPAVESGFLLFKKQEPYPSWYDLGVAMYNEVLYSNNPEAYRDGSKIKFRGDEPTEEAPGDYYYGAQTW